jgi:hypothetical protein
MTIALGTLLALLGLTMIALTIARGGGPFTIGILVGLAFTALGCARVYLAAGPRSPRRP